MTDDARDERNRTRLQEAHPAFRAALARVIARLQAQGYRPRIQQCWRSEADQLAAKRSGHSELAWGLHNATSPAGEPEALAADVLDDDAPLAPSLPYLFALARAARAEGLRTGIDWGLPAPIRASLQAAITQNIPWENSVSGKPGPIGWDPQHVQWDGISIADAKAGARPEGGPVVAGG